MMQAKPLPLVPAFPDWVFNDLSREYADFLKDFGTSEPFLVDGDALIAFAFSNQHLDWNYGGQMLHATYIVEHFLAGLRQVGAMFEVFFFSGNAECFARLGPSYRLARDAIIHHLRCQAGKRCTGLKFHVLRGSWGNPSAAEPRSTSDTKHDWAALVGSFNPAFILSNDVLALDEGASRLQRSFVMTSLCKNFFVVTMAEMEFQGSEVMAFVIKPPLGGKHRRALKEAVESVRASARPIQRVGDGGGDLAVKLPPKTAIHSDVREGVVFSALSRLAQSHPPAQDQYLAAILIAKILILREQPTSFRAVALPASDPLNLADKTRTFIRTIHTTMADALNCMVEQDDADVDTTNIPDLFDGRFFHALVLLGCEGLKLPRPIEEEASNLWRSTGLLQASGRDFKASAQLPDGFADRSVVLRLLVECRERSKASKAHANRIPPLRASRAGDSFLPDSILRVQDRIARALGPAASGSSDRNVSGGATASVRKFTSDHHFHSSRPLCKDPDHLKLLPGHSGRVSQLEEFAKAKVFKTPFHKEKWMRKQQQKQANNAVKLASSLLAGLPVEPQPITERLSAAVLQGRKAAAEKSLSRDAEAGARDDDGTDKPAASKEDPSGKPKKGAGKAQPKKLSKADQIRQANTDATQKKVLEAGAEKLSSIKRDHRPTNPTANKYASLVKAYVQQLHNRQAELARERGARRLEETTHARLMCGVGRELLDVLASIPVGTFRVRETFLVLQSLLRLPHASLVTAIEEGDTKKKGQGHKVFADAASSVGFTDVAAKIIEVFGSDSKAAKAKSSKRGEDTPQKQLSAVRYQLETVPEHLQRPPGVSGEDARVMFKPDPWQVRLLDIVDSGNSALVVAPTASGKTFISYYIMEQCLRTDDEGLVVFVAPNQVWAEVKARFSKSYQGGGKLSGVFTRDHRENVMDCQILVTVPQCLSILLLSAEEDNVQWASRIRHVIFDEVHMLGSGGGEVWEQLVLLVQAPFVALSATLGDVDGFFSWMKRVEASKQRDVHLVVHKERHNDLLPWVFDPAHDRLVLLHPFVVLIDLIKEVPIRQFPEDLKLLPEHCLAAVSAMEGRLPPGRCAALAPETFFNARRDDAEWNISMLDVREWEEEVKAAFCSLRREEQRDVIQTVGSGGLQAFESTDRTLGEEGDAALESKLVALVQELGDKELLPALCFRMNRRGCKDLARSLTAHLAEQEEQARAKENWQEQVNRCRAELRNLGAAGSDASTKEELQQDMMEHNEQRAGLEAKLDRLHDIDWRFAIAPSRGLPVKESEILEALMLDRDDIPEDYEWLFAAMRRGIGVHHSGLNKKWRQATEQLVRLKRLGVIFATGTLAMGINFPCKTSVLVGDAIYLNAMLYRQTTGRAGRRGMDLRGHTVFYCVSCSKVVRLMRARLPSLQGNVVLSPSLVLRLLMRQSILDDAVDGARQQQRAALTRHQEEAAKACGRLVDLPLFAPWKLLAEQASHNFHFCIELLQTQGLLMRDSQGKLAPNDLSALISHLYFMEPSNFAFLTLLQSGHLAELCQPGPLREERVISLLCHLFCRRPIPQWLAVWLVENERTGPSLITLEKPSDEVVKILEAQTAQAVETLQDFWQAFVLAYAEELGEDDRLPLTGSKHGGEQTTRVAQVESLLLKSRVRSSFVALSGHDDCFRSVSDICNTTRAGLHIDSKLVPAFEFSDMQFNSYILDFYKHGQKEALVRYNKIKDDDVWDSLSEFNLCLKALYAAMERRVLAGGAWVEFADENVLTTFRTISEVFNDKLKAIAE